MIETAAKVNSYVVPGWVPPVVAGFLVFVLLCIWIGPKFRAKCVNCNERPHMRGEAWCDNCIIESVARAQLRRHKDQAGNN